MRAFLSRQLSRTAGYHEVCAADEDRDDGGGCCEDWEECGIFPKRVYWNVVDGPNRRARPPTYQHQRARKEGNYGKARWEVGSAPVGISSSEPFPILNHSGSPSPER